VDPTSSFRDLGSPAPGVNTTGPADGIMDVGSAFFVPEGWRRGNQFNVRADYELRPGKDRLYGNFYRTNSYAVTGGIRPAFNRPTPNTTHFGNINYTRTFSSSKLNELRAGVMRLVGLPDVPLHLEIPGITFNSGGVSSFGQSGYPNGWWQTNYHFKDIFTVIKSTHQLKMGGELRQMYGSATNTNNYIPAYQFANLLDFADDEALQMTRYVDPRTGEPMTAYSELTQTEWAVFIDDDWKVTRNLTIKMGLRYENYGTFKDSDDTLRNIVFGPGATLAEQLASARVDFVNRFNPTDNNNFGPRLGFAWDPKGDGKMAVRGGYGLSYDRLMNLPAENYRHSPPLRASVTDFPVPAAGLNGTLVRNAYRGPGYVDVSLSLSKKLELTPKVNAEIRFDAFNALNRVNLADPNMDLSSANFGKSTSQFNPRPFQLGARLRF
jgi:hypothetical protein